MPAGHGSGGDLHGLRRDEAREQLGAFLRDAAQRGLVAPGSFRLNEAVWEHFVVDSELDISLGQILGGEGRVPLALGSNKGGGGAGGSADPHGLDVDELAQANVSQLASEA